MNNALVKEINKMKKALEKFIYKKAKICLYFTHNDGEIAHRMPFSFGICNKYGAKFEYRMHYMEDYDFNIEFSSYQSDHYEIKIDQSQLLSKHYVKIEIYFMDEIEDTKTFYEVFDTWCEKFEKYKKYEGPIQLDIEY